MCDRQLTTWENEQVAFHQGYNVPAQWFVGQRQDNDQIEVIALGDGFVWSLLIDEPRGEVHTSEATVMDFSTGLEI